MSLDQSRWNERSIAKWERMTRLGHIHRSMQTSNRRDAAKTSVMIDEAPVNQSSCCRIPACCGIPERCRTPACCRCTKGTASDRARPNRMLSPGTRLTISQHCDPTRERGRSLAEFPHEPNAPPATAAQDVGVAARAESRCRRTHRDRRRNCLTEVGESRSMSHSAGPNPNRENVGRDFDKT